MLDEETAIGLFDRAIWVFMHAILGRQTTLAKPVILSGIGVHSGAPARINIRPGEAASGIRFRRRMDDGKHVDIPATYNQVVATELCTVIGSGAATVSTIEHLMAAFAALGVDNALVEIDGPEMPILDGCASEFVAAINGAGLVEQRPARRAIRVTRAVRVENGQSVAEFLPFAGRRYDLTIDFPHPMIGRQSYVFDMTAESFRQDIAPARTFGLVSDVEKLRAMGYAKGSSLENSLGFTATGILNPEGPRFPDECVRHKVLDAIGDLALAGLPFVGHFRSVRGGHKLNRMAVAALLSDETAYELVSNPAHAEASAGSVGLTSVHAAPAK